LQLITHASYSGGTGLETWLWILMSCHLYSGLKSSGMCYRAVAYRDINVSAESAAFIHRTLP
jgi:hypothetical protein